MIAETQIALEDINEEYAAFVDKFKPKKTTDDCYTPENIFNAVLGWVCREYGLDAKNNVRPFYPGGDYRRFDYPADCFVCDNPPFSILGEIRAFYQAHSIPYFLFAPSLTCFNAIGDCAIVAGAEIVYENGAGVKTSFVTNFDKDHFARSCPELFRLIKAQNDKNTKPKAELPKYKYPDNVITAAMMQKYSERGVDFTVRKSDAGFIRQLDSQKSSGKALFGAGYLLSEKAAAEKAAAEKAAAEKAAAEKAAAEKAAAEKAVIWELSEREREIVKMLGDRK